jgi:hypothetical protein
MTKTIGQTFQAMKKLSSTRLLKVPCKGIRIDVARVILWNRRIGLNDAQVRVSIDNIRRYI